MNTWSNWVSGRQTPKFWRAPDIAKGLGCTVSELFEREGDDRCIAEIRLSKQTLSDVRRQGLPGAQEAADRLAKALVPVIYESAKGRKLRPNASGRAKQRRTREQVLAGVQSATTARLRTAELLKQARGDHPRIELEP